MLRLKLVDVIRALAWSSLPDRVLRLRRSL